MKVVQINATYGIGSTGKICAYLVANSQAANIENYVLYSSGNFIERNGSKFSSTIYTKIQALKSRIMGNYGFNSRWSTQRLIAQLDKIKPDIVHLHNIHSHDCNLRMLFQYLRNKKTRIIWTFHDCWAFTGYCPHFDMIGCNHWENGCGNCPQYREYSWFVDRSDTLFHWKKELLHGIDLMIVTPSKWLADLAKRSFLGAYPIRVIHNGIDLSVFEPTESDFRKNHNLVGKKMVLGVAFDWGKRKGLDVMIHLARKLPEDYRIILVGTNDLIDKQLPASIISIHRTLNQKELAAIYSAADVFVNATREENFPTVNIEAIACGTPVVTFQTGGSPEILDDSCGSVVERDDIEALEREVYRICETKPYSVADCRRRAQKFNMNDCYRRYIELYEENRVGRD